MIHAIFYKSVGAFFYFLSMASLPKGIIVLLYHQVSDNQEPNPLVVSTQTFRQQMQYLHNQKYRVIGISELVSDLKNQKCLNSKTALITFDDGYRGVYLSAYPILKKFGFPATIFLTTGMIEADKANPKYINASGLDMLSWEEVHEMAQDGIEFGVHTVKHLSLTKMSIKEAKQEIAESKKIISQFMGLSVKAFAYPYGEYNAEIKKLVREAGFTCAFTARPGINRKDRDLWELKRIPINDNDSLSDFKIKIIDEYGMLHRLAQIRLESVLRKALAHLKSIKKWLSS